MIPFTEEEKISIGDFIHAIQSDTLIIHECEKLVDTLANHNLINNKSEWLDKIKNKSNGLAEELKQELMAKISKDQGSEIMDEYFGHSKSSVKEKSEETKENHEQHYRWGVGRDAGSKAFDTIKLGDSEFDLIFGEYPHSRQDNNTYARNKKYPEDITEFNGHRLPFKIEINEYNYLKDSSLSGSEIRKGCAGKLFLDSQQIFECGGRTYEGAFRAIEHFIGEMEEMWSWFPKNIDKEIGRLVKYEGQMFKINSFIVSQACMILETADGKPRKPFASESEEFEEGDFEQETSIKVEITSDHIWWYPTDKEKEKYESQ